MGSIMGRYEDKRQRIYSLQFYILDEKTLPGALCRLLQGHPMFLDYRLSVLDNHLYNCDWADTSV